MKTASLSLRRTILLSMVMAGSFLVFLPVAPLQAVQTSPQSGAQASSPTNTLTSNATVLSYLIEMERQTGKGCNNETVELPSLMPSPELTEIADILATSDTQLDEILTLRGLDKASVYSAFVNATSAQEAVKKLRQTNCTQLLSARYSQIGSNQHGSRWTVLMAGEQRLPTNESSADIIVNPYEPSETSANNQSGQNQQGQGQPDQSNQTTQNQLGHNRSAQNQPSQPGLPGLTPPAAAPVHEEGQEKVREKAAATVDTRQTHGKYSDGEPVYLPSQSEHRDAATPQVTGVYDDHTLTPEKMENQPAPAAPLAPLPYYPESNRDPNEASPPQVTGEYRE